MSLYVSRDAEPSASDYDFVSQRPGNNEVVRVASVEAGTYYVKVVGQSAFSGVTVQARHAEPVEGGDGGLQNGVPVTGISGAASSQQFWTIEVPAGTSSLTVAMSGGTGDADLYVRAGSQPTTTAYDCRPYLTGNNETCTISNPAAGTYHVLINAYTAFEGVSLTATW